MEPRFETLTEKKLVGIHTRMSLANVKTPQLWGSFTPLQKDIKNRVSVDRYSLEVYDDISYFNNFNPAKEFEKWAAVEVTDFNSIPEVLDTITLSGFYAVFIYKGAANEGAKAYQYIYADWLPKSGFVLDNRPHFALMGEKYKGNAPDSEEELWVPVKPR